MSRLKIGWIFLVFVASLALAEDPTRDMPEDLPEDMSEEGGVKDAEFYDAAGALRCPTCTGLSVLDSDAMFSEKIKAKVRELLAEGKTKADILLYFEERYGPWILREPPKKGAGLIVWIIPFLLLLLVLVAVVFRMMKQHSWASQQESLTDEGVILEQLYREISEKRYQR